jgi:hypothetical protein
MGCIVVMVVVVGLCAVLTLCLFHVIIMLLCHIT